MPHVGGDVAEIPHFDFEFLVADLLEAAALDVVFQRVAVGVVPVGTAVPARGENVKVVDVEP